MSWSYSGDPSDSNLDEVRFWLQDTDSTDQLLTDEEIEFVIAAYAESVGSNLFAAAVCAESVAAKFAREVNVSADNVSVSIQDLQQKYENLALSLRDQYKAKQAGALPLAGGMLYNEYPDTTVKPLSFGKAMHDNVRGGRQDYGGAAFQYPDYPEDALQ